jgi:hypothetical protein
MGSSYKNTARQWIIYPYADWSTFKKFKMIIFELYVEKKPHAIHDMAQHLLKIRAEAFLLRYLT